jgi:dipeptidyl aminopeptidase/acylaminoacyl peptidase
MPLRAPSRPPARSGARCGVLLRAALLAPALLVPALHTAGAQRPALTTADYDRAARMLGTTVNALVVGGTVNATWRPDDRFYYRSVTPEGASWVMVDPARRTRAPLFPAAAVAQALTRAGAGAVDARNFPARRAELSPDGSRVTLAVGARRWTCEVSGASCAAAPADPAARPTGAAAAGAGPAVVSPDGRRAAFIRDWNLWVRDVATGRETALTTDGVPDFGYATDNAGWTHSDRAILLWSPDSKKIATQQQDERRVGDMHLIETRVGRPRLVSWKYPLPGDSVVAMIHRVVIDVDAGRVVRLATPPDYHRAMLGDDLSMDDLSWSPDGARLAYVSTSRDHKRATVRVADAVTGAVRTVFEETSPTQFESVAGWRVLWKTNEILWSSERDDWAHLYAYDLATGRQLRQVTTGAGPVQGIAHLDEARRTVIVEAQGRTPGEDPYFRHYYRVGLDGRGWRALTPERADHAVQVSPSGRYFVDTYSTPEVPPVAVLRDAEGRVVMPLERADASRLLAAGWKPPIPIVTKAHDGATDLYGLMFRPTNFDPTKKYPIINNPYPGPQSGSVGTRSFAAARGDRQALAELGFVVVTVDAMGTPGRSKRFHDSYYGAMGRDNTIADQVAAMRALAARYPWVDAGRAGVYGHSGGGFLAADAMFRAPEFFKVGVAESGNHDQRNYEDDWGERYQGLLARPAGASAGASAGAPAGGPAGAPDSYAAEANQDVAKNLRGRLLLAHGSMDDNVPPSNTELVVDALIKANKDFDLLVIPNAAHGYGAATAYMTRRRWDYFVRHLLGAEPPREYEIAAPGAAREGAR